MSNVLVHKIRYILREPDAYARSHQALKQNWGISFNNLFNFVNVPPGRSRQCLLQSGNLEKYIEKLASNFNPCAIDVLMRHTLVSIPWDGYLYDYDFNLARNFFRFVFCLKEGNHAACQ